MRIVFDSRDRNRAAYPALNPYTINLQELTFSPTCIQYVTVDVVIVPAAVFTSFPYITLRIPELHTNGYCATNQDIADSLQVLTPKFIANGFAYCTPKNRITIPGPPISRLGRVTIQFLDPNGNMINFGSDTTPPTAVDASVQHMIHLSVEGPSE